MVKSRFIFLIICSVCRLANGYLCQRTFHRYSVKKVYAESTNTDMTNLFKETELDILIKSMPVNEKYSILIQSYTRKILENKKGDDDISDLLEKMKYLYMEMVEKSIKPEIKSSINLIDASASFCNLGKVSSSLELIKFGTIDCFNCIEMIINE